MKTFLIALCISFGSMASGQVVRTYTTGDLFKKRRAKKEAEEKARQDAIAAEKKKEADACDAKSKEAIAWANAFSNMVATLPRLVNSNNTLNEQYIGTVRKKHQELAALLPETNLYTDEAAQLTAACHDCRDRGYVHLNETGYGILADVEPNLNKKFGEMMDKLESWNTRTRKLLALDQNAIFVDQASGPTKPKEAQAEHEKVSNLLPVLGGIMENASFLQAAYGSRMESVEKSVSEIEGKLGDIREAFFASPYHKAHPNTIAFSAQPVTPGQEDSQLISVYKPGEPLSFAMYVPKPFRQMFGYTTGSLQLSIGGQVVGRLPVYVLRDEVLSTGFATAQLLWPTAAGNIEANSPSDKDIEALLRTFSRLTPVRHTVTAKWTPQYSKPSSVKGEIVFDLTGGTQPFIDLADAIARERNEREEDKILANYTFRNQYKSSTLRATVERELVKAGNGQVKRARVFFEDYLWTAVTGTSRPYRYLEFEYLLEDTEGNYYVGRSSISQDALTNGSYDTKQTAPDSDIVDPYGDGKLLDASQNENSSSSGQRKVTKSKVAKYW